MTLEEFEQNCIKAIKDLHDPKLDGPLLLGVRENGKYLLADSLGEEGWQTWPEYAAVVGCWPDNHNGRDYGHYMLEPKDAISELVRHLQEAHEARQPEPEPMVPSPYDALLD